MASVKDLLSDSLQDRSFFKLVFIYACVKNLQLFGEYKKFEEYEKSHN